MNPEPPALAPPLPHSVSKDVWWSNDESIKQISIPLPLSDSLLFPPESRNYTGSITKRKKNSPFVGSIGRQLVRADQRGQRARVELLVVPQSPGDGPRVCPGSVWAVKRILVEAVNICQAVPDVKLIVRGKGDQRLEESGYTKHNVGRIPA